MRVTLLAYGTRGDVQPQLALAMALADAGHEVTMATNRAWADLADACDVPIHPIDVDPVEMSKIWEEQQTELDQGWAWHRYVRTLRDKVKPLLRTFWDESVAACAKADAVLFTQLGFPGFHIAQAQRIPGMFTTPVPIGSTREYAAPWISAHRATYGGLGNRFTHFLNDFPWLLFRRTLTAWRAELGLRPLGGFDVTRRMERAGVPRLCGYSPAVVPRPADWGPRAHVTGFWFLPRVPPYEPPPGLEAFLADDATPVVYADVGSMIDHLPDDGLASIATGVTGAGARLLITRPDRIEVPASDGVLAIGAVPHEWVMPQVSAVIHHAGAGTTGATVRAGVPSISLPVLGDQHFWAQRLHSLGVAAPPLSAKALDAASVAAAVSAATAPAVRSSAAAMGTTVDAEDGVGEAVDLIHRYAATAVPAP